MAQKPLTRKEQKMYYTMGAGLMAMFGLFSAIGGVAAAVALGINGHFIWAGAVLVACLALAFVFFRLESKHVHAAVGEDS